MLRDLPLTVSGVLRPVLLDLLNSLVDHRFACHRIGTSLALLPLLAEACKLNVVGGNLLTTP